MREISDEDAKFATKMFSRRHVSEHNAGVADQKYLGESGDNSVMIGEAIRETSENATRLGPVPLEMMSNIDVRFLLREVIFVDLALAQLAALGVAVAHMVASEASPATITLAQFQETCPRKLKAAMWLLSLIGALNRFAEKIGGGAKKGLQVHLSPARVRPSPASRAAIRRDRFAPACVHRQAVQPISTRRERGQVFRTVSGGFAGVGATRDVREVHNAAHYRPQSRISISGGSGCADGFLGELYTKVTISLDAAQPLQYSNEIGGWKWRKKHQGRATARESVSSRLLKCSLATTPPESGLNPSAGPAAPIARDVAPTTSRRTYLTLP